MLNQHFGKYKYGLGFIVGRLNIKGLKSELG